MTSAEPNQPTNTAKEDKKLPPKVEELSEEDLALKTSIESKVDILVNSSDSTAISAALEGLASDVRGATSSMTAVPKPLKFLRPHFEPLYSRYQSLPHSGVKQAFADVLSVVSTVVPPKDTVRRSLSLRLAGTGKDLTGWGPEYMRALTGEIAEEYAERTASSYPVADLFSLIDEIVPYYMSHSGEVDAVDLLSEVDQIERIIPLVDNPDSSSRVCLYLGSIAAFENREKLLKVSFDLSLRAGDFAAAVRVGLKLGSPSLVAEAVNACPDNSTQQQVSYLIARHGIKVPNLPEQLNPILNNESLSVHYKALAKELDVVEAKTPEEVFKTHLEERKSTIQLDSAKQNLAASFSNAFVNLGHGTDKLLTVEGSGWLFKNKDLGMLSTAASLGLITLWDLDEGLAQIDKFQWSSDSNVKAGALLGFGLLSCGNTNECDPAFALLAEHVESEDVKVKQAAFLGLGFSYAGTRREDLRELLTPGLLDADAQVEVVASAALALGMIFCGSGDEEVAEMISQAIHDRVATTSFFDSVGFLFAVALGMVNFGTRKITTTEDIADKEISRYLKIITEGMAFAGTGDVLKIQSMLQTVAEIEAAIDPAATEPTQSSVSSCAALLCCSLIALSEETGCEMLIRVFDRVHQYSSPALKRAIPLSLALLHLSNPKPQVVDSLSKFSHDNDPEIAANAILAMGLVGLGTNNSKLSGLFRQLAAYFAKEPSVLFSIRLAQGWLYAGKGLVTCSPLHSDRFLLNPVATSGLAVLLFSILTLKVGPLTSSYHYLIYFLVPALKPRMLVTLDAETGKAVPVAVRVGQSLDVVGMAGKPKSITGSQTHVTPVLLQHGEKAELAVEDWIPVGGDVVLEGIVLLKKKVA